MRLPGLALIGLLLTLPSCSGLPRGRPVLKIAGYPDIQQTLDYGCGPAAAVAFARFHGIAADQRAAAQAMGTNPKTGTAPEAIAAWLAGQGLRVRWAENGRLDGIKANLRRGKPTLVEWVDWGGHWVAVVGFDDSGTVCTDDDELILADPYDRVDGKPDGLTFVNAERFETMWFDALNFGRVMQRIYIETAD